MIWHIVSFDMSSLDEALRVELEQQLADLQHLEEVAWLAVSRDIDEPGTTGLLSLFASYADLEAYRTHPRHVPVVQRIRELGVPVTRLDVEAGVPPGEPASP